MSDPASNREWQPKILAFLCNWCSYAGADLAGVSRLQYPPTIRVLRVPCSGRVNPLYILKALQQGVDGVLVSGCHPGDCHYLTGNYFARRKFHLLKALLDFTGIEEGRVQFSWVSAAEGARFASVIAEVTERVRALGPARRMVKTGWLGDFDKALAAVGEGAGCGVRGSGAAAGVRPTDGTDFGQGTERVTQ
jgi:coenzyme F420-reducing hydrogenase delta subunit